MKFSVRSQILQTILRLRHIIFIKMHFMHFNIDLKEQESLAFNTVGKGSKMNLRVWKIKSPNNQLKPWIIYTCIFHFWKKYSARRNLTIFQDKRLTCLKRLPKIASRK